MSQNRFVSTREQTIVMTGASRGIGLAAAKTLLALWPNTHLVLLGRNDADNSARNFGTDRARVSTIYTDLSSLHSVAHGATAVADHIRSHGLPPIRGLVCNAGVQYTNALTETVDGFEATFAINVLANHVLVRRLYGHLHERARVVITVSDTHFGNFRHNLGMVPGPKWCSVETLARIDAFPDQSNTAAGRRAYSTSKLAAIYLIHEYVRRFPGTRTFIGYNPGFVPGTDLARAADPISRLAMRWIMPALVLTPLAHSPGKAGRFLADAAGGTHRVPTGAYVDRAKVAKSSPESYDPQREHDTWEAVETLTAGFLPPFTTPRKKN